jgi:FtsP/CotA-like multicopper oxidase with cupredoxin domain
MRGDRVAPGETFTYRWTCPQRAAAGVWLYQDGASLGLENLRLGAFGALIIRAPGEQAPDLPKGPLRRAGDTPTVFASVPLPPMRGEYLLVFHELPGIGLCLNGRQLLGNTPTLVAGDGTRMSVRCLNATTLPLSVTIQGHRWESGGRWVDVELLPPAGGTTMEILSGSSEGGGGLGEWFVTGRSGNAEVSGTLVTTAGGKVSLVG